MKKAIGYIAFFAVLIFLVSAYSERVVKAEKGYTAPEIEMVSNGSKDIALSSLRGKYVLVNFWDSGSAVSRIAANEYDKFSRSKKKNKFELLSINTDDNKKLFKEIVKNDNLDNATQYHIGEVKTKNTRKDYRIEQGFSSYLINPQGKVVAVNPSVTTLEKYLSGN